jgi:hypothetical protein
MKGSAAFVLALAALIAATLVQVKPASADRYHRFHKHRHHVRVVYTADTPVAYPCRVGWWQGLRYGHVQPHWGGRCY